MSPIIQTQSKNNTTQSTDENGNPINAKPLYTFIYNFFLKLYLHFINIIYFVPTKDDNDPDYDSDNDPDYDPENDSDEEEDESHYDSEEEEESKEDEEESKEEESGEESDDSDYEVEEESDDSDDGEESDDSDDGEEEEEEEESGEEDEEEKEKKRVDKSYRRCIGTTKKGVRCRINTNMVYDENRPSYIQDVAIKMMLNGSQLCSYHQPETVIAPITLEIGPRRPMVHPVIYGMFANYKSSMSWYEKTAELNAACEENGIPTDIEQAWEYLTDKPELQQKYNVNEYY